MKAFFRAEAVGLNFDRECRSLSMGKVRDPVNRPPWLAEITGTDPRYAFGRRFLTPKVDYRNANATGSRGIDYCWTLESGRFYEASHRAGWTGYTREFLAVTPEGEVRRVSRAEVYRWLGTAEE